MAAKYAKKTVTLQGDVAVEAAEELANWLKKTPNSTVNIKGCGHLHAAVLQVLLALKPRLQGEPADPWLRAVLTPALARGQLKGR